jgi:5-methylcytosine-specific restriction endonuclease McrA
VSTLFWNLDEGGDPYDERPSGRDATYEDYLQSATWREIRRKAIAHAGFACQVCNSPDRLHVHHRRYPRWGTETYEDLIVLCALCHTLFHERLKLVGGWDPRRRG